MSYRARRFFGGPQAFLRQVGRSNTAWPVWLMLIATSLAIAACLARPVPPSAPPDAEALRQDAQRYAEDMGVDLDEAVRRLQYQDDIGRLNAALAANERDTFAGLWMQHQPDFRVIVRFTRDGEATIRPYIEGQPWAHLIEVRSASVTLAELQAIQRETSQALDKLDFGVTHALDVKGNRIEVYVTDLTWFEEQLKKADIQLADRVELVVVEGQSAKEIDICAPSPVTGVAFPRQQPVEGVRAMMAAELTGELVLVDDCLRINSIYGGTVLPVWPAEFTLRGENDEIQILDGNGQVVARVGEEVYMGGGEGSPEALADCVREQLPAACTGPYWIVGGGVRPNLRRDSDLFSVEVIPATEGSLLLLHKKPVLDEWAEGDSEIIGQLVLYHPDRCPRVRSEDGLTNYVPLWPPDYGARFRNGAAEMVDGSGNVVARVGETLSLSGGPITVDWNSEMYRQLRQELPGDCHGPYWVVRDDGDIGAEPVNARDNRIEIVSLASDSQAGEPDPMPSPLTSTERKPEAIAATRPVGTSPTAMPSARAFLPLVQKSVCTTHTASMTLEPTATTLEVGDLVTVTATLVNHGCGMLGLPQYRLSVQSAETQPIFEPANPEPVTHYLGISRGQSDTAQFVLQALRPGQTTLSASASFEVHLGYPGPAYWSSSSAGPRVITVLPPATVSPDPTPSPTPTSTPPTLLVHKMAQPEAISPDDVITYTIVMMNDMLGASDPGASVELTDDIPAHTTYVAGTATGGAQYDAAADTITWAGAVPRGDSATVSFQVRVAGDAPAGEEIENVALITDALGRVSEVRASVSLHAPAAQ